jgi:hypothetical protein
VVDEIYDHKELLLKKSGDKYELENLILDAPFSMQKLLKSMLEVKEEKRADWFIVHENIEEQPDFRLLQ